MIELGPHRHDLPPPLLHLVPQLLDVGDEGAILPAGEEEILVAIQQITEGLGGDDDLEWIECAAFVDLDETAGQNGALFRQIVLRQGQLRARDVDVAVEAADLGLQLVHDAVGALPLPLKKVELLIEIMDLTLQPVPLFLELFPLSPDFLQPPS